MFNLPNDTITLACNFKPIRNDISNKPVLIPIVVIGCRLPGTVIPALSRNPETQQWIPAFAGMTECDNYFFRNGTIEPYALRIM